MKKGGVNPFIHKSEKNTIQDHDIGIWDAGLKGLLKY